MGGASNITKSSSYLANDYYNYSSSHSINCISEAEHYARGRRCGSSHDWSTGYRRSWSPSITNKSYKINFYCIFVCELRCKPVATMCFL